MGKDTAGNGERELMRGADTTTGGEVDGSVPAADDAPPGYEAPAIVYRAPLEATAAFCDPMEYGKTEGYCWLGPINS